MSIENSLKRIADALEALVSQKAGVTVSVETAKIVEAVVSPAPASPAPAPAPAAPTPAAPTPAAPTPAAPTPAMTMEQLNGELVAEFKRLGGRDGIDTAIKALNNGNASVTTLPPAQYAALIAAVKAL